MKTMQTESLTIRLSKAESAALRGRARRDRVSRGALVRQALRAYGATPDPRPARSGYDVIKHLIGKYRGRSRDLSTNPCHMEGFGE